MKKLKIYEIKFEALYPVPCGLIVLAKNKKEALEIASNTIAHTQPVKAKRIKADKPKVVFYESGDY